MFRGSRWLPRVGAVLSLAAVLALSTGATCINPEPTCGVLPTPQIAGIAVSTSPTLQGWVDLHTHPVSNLGFAGKLVYGGIDGAPDGGAMLATDPDCKDNVDATSPTQALGHCGSTHGTPLQSPCGDFIRALVVDTLNKTLGGNAPGTDSTGYPDFGQWPKWNEVTHQVMWIDWLKRAYLGGMRVLVALAVNNKTLADAVRGPHDDVDDDKQSADLQIGEIKNLVSRHADWMEIAYRSSDVPRILKANKLAIVMGLEVDNIGDFNTVANLTEAEVHAEILRLYGMGVRYIFPIHVIDNPFGTAAAYQDLFNLSNLREDGHFYNLVCSEPEDAIGYMYTSGNPLEAARDPFTAGSLNLELAAAMIVKLGMIDDANDAPTVPSCNTPMTGMVNRGAVYPGLTPLGKFAILDMMRQGMFLDVDHMSQASATDTVALALQEQYPVNSGHNVVREYAPMPHGSSERNLSAALYAQIAKVHGMAGVGLASTDEVTWVGQYKSVLQALGQPGAVAGFGTDTNGLSPLMPPPPQGTPLLQYTDAFPQSGFGCASWNFNDAGVANYGMLADLVQSLPLVPGGADVKANLLLGAQYFYDTWALIDAYRAAHQADAGVGPIAAQSITVCEPGTAYAPACKRCLPPSVTCAGAPPVCPPPRRVDEWGLCVRATPPPPSVGLHAGAPLPLERRIPAGAYTLQLQARHDARGALVNQAATFDIEVGAEGQLVGLDPSAGVTASGEFRPHQLLLRVHAGREQVALIAHAQQGDSASGVDGGMAAYAPGAPVVTGSFSLRPSAHAPASGPRSLTTVTTFLRSLYP